MKPLLTPIQRADCKTGQMVGNISPPLRRHGSSRRRIQFEDRESFYHVISRTAGGEMLFGDEILTYAVMDNHFHILIRAPEREKFLRCFRGEDGQCREEKLLDHLSLLYSRLYIR